MKKTCTFYKYKYKYKANLYSAVSRKRIGGANAEYKKTDSSKAALSMSMSPGIRVWVRVNTTLHVFQ